MKTNKLLCRFAVSSLIVPALLADPVTDNSHDDFDPQVSGDLIVWLSDVPDDVSDPDDSEIMVSYQGVVSQITDNTGDDENVKISGTVLVWQSWDGEDWEIWTYNAATGTATQLTDNATDDINPAVDGSTVVWQAWDGEDYEIETTSIAALVPVEAGLRITPRALNLRSKGRWVSATLNVGDSGVAPGDIDPATILLQGVVPAANVAVKGTVLKMKFDRQALQALLSGAGDVELTVTAETSGGGVITGTDVIRTIP